MGCMGGTVFYKVGRNVAEDTPMNQNFFDDMAKMAGGAFQSADAFRKQMETIIKDKVGDCAKSWHLVTEEQLAGLRTLIVALEARVAALEANATPPATAKTTDVA